MGVFGIVSVIRCFVGAVLCYTSISANLAKLHHPHLLSPFARMINLRSALSATDHNNSCLEWEYEYDLFNFNYAKDCSLIVHIDRGEHTVSTRAFAPSTAKVPPFNYFGL